MELKEWIKAHWIWSILIGLVLLYGLISFLPAMSSLSEDYSPSDTAEFLRGGGSASFEEPLYDSGYESESPAPMMAIGNEGTGKFQAEQPAAAERKITKAASIETEVETGKFKETESKVRADVSSLGGFILNENVQLHKNKDAAYYTGVYTIKVERGKYVSLVAKLKEIPELQSFSESADDITEQYTDLEVELKVEKERLARYKALYAEINNTEDKIDMIDRLFNQERTIGYIEKSLKEAGKTLDYYTAYFYLSEKEPNFFDVEFVGASKLAANILNSTSSLLELASSLLPFLIVGFGIWGIRHHFKSKNSLAEKPALRKK